MDNAEATQTHPQATAMLAPARGCSVLLAGHLAQHTTKDDHGGPGRIALDPATARLGNAARGRAGARGRRLAVLVVHGIGAPYPSPPAEHRKVPFEGGSTPENDTRATAAHVAGLDAARAARRPGRGARRAGAQRIQPTARRPPPPAAPSRPARRKQLQKKEREKERKKEKVNERKRKGKEDTASAALRRLRC